MALVYINSRIISMVWKDGNLIEVLQNGGIVVMPTDTIYGIVGRAEDRNVVEKIYEIRKRTPEKPCIVLIGNTEELDKFSIKLSDEQKAKLQKFWYEENRPISVVLDCLEEKFAYLHRGTNSLAFRLPASQELRDLLLKTGPLIAPSANLEKFPASENIEDARKYFGDQVDLYVDGGLITSKASRVIKLHKDGTESILRE